LLQFSSFPLEKPLFLEYIDFRIHAKGVAFLIQWVYEQGWSSSVYYAFHVLGFLAVVLFNLWYGPKLGFSKGKSLLTTFIVYGITYIWIYIQCWAETGFRIFGGNNIVRGFVYVPLFGWPVAKLLKLSWERMCCLIAPCVCLVHGISHLGCIFGGCCRGYEWSWGIYNPLYRAITYPVQIFESLTALACADVTGDGRWNVGDTATLYAHIRNTKKLY
jgi:hypothetical protein